MHGRRAAAYAAAAPALHAPRRDVARKALGDSRVLADGATRRAISDGRQLADGVARRADGMYRHADD